MNLPHRRRQGRKEHFDAFKSVNLGIGGDQTSHVHWRNTEGKELENLKPNAAVILIGTNIKGGQSAVLIADGINAPLATAVRSRRGRWVIQCTWTENPLLRGLLGHRCWQGDERGLNSSR
jgi:hypothetical protein